MICLRGNYVTELSNASCKLETFGICYGATVSNNKFFSKQHIPNWRMRNVCGFNEGLSDMLINSFTCN